MELVVAVIENPDDVNPILDRLYENDIPGATVIDSRGMGHMIADHTSIFSRFSDLTGGEGASKHSNVIFTVLEDEKMIEKAVNIINETVGGMDRPDTGIVFTLPVNRVLGFETKFNDQK